MIEITALIAIVVGLVNCFLGYRIFRITLLVVGFAIGFSVVAGAMADTDQSTLLIAGTVAGLIGAWLISRLYFAAVFIAGLLFGASVAYSLLLSLGIEAQTVVIGAVIVGMVLGGMLALSLNRIMIILATATGGAAAVAGGISELFLETPYSTAERGFLLMVVIVLAIFGFREQYRHRD